MKPSLFIKLHLGLILLKTNNIEMLDIWYYNNYLHKECILTLIKQSDIDRYLPILTGMVKAGRAKITFIYYIEHLDKLDHI